jgi:hypothetical protein
LSNELKALPEAEKSEETDLPPTLQVELAWAIPSF